MNFRSKNLLITGGAGFIGLNFIKHFSKIYPKTKIYNLDKLTYAANINEITNIRNLNNYKFIKGDICDEKLISRVFNEFKIDGVINFAAESHVDNSILNPDKFIETNINGLYTLLKVSLKNWMESPFIKKKEFDNSRFHQISTDEVYGSTEKESFTENSLYMPNSPYSSSKASAELLVRSFNKTYGLDTVITVSSNNYGPYQNNEKFIPKVIDSIKKGIEIPIYGNGNNVRDWIYVIDHCDAIIKIFNESPEGERYNVGGNFEISNIELVNLIYSLFPKDKNYTKKIKFVNDRFGHDFRYSLNSEKIKTIFNWIPVRKFTEKIREQINYEK